MRTDSWHQVSVKFPDPTRAEDFAVAHLTPIFTMAEADRLISAWFFIRKTPEWRVRYLASPETTGARAYILGRLFTLRRNEHIEQATDVIYEPEFRAFGGVQAMEISHRLWHVDSRHVLAHLARTASEPAVRRRREISVLLYSAMMRAAGLDWYEQGDVWAKVAEHRDPPDDLDPVKCSELRVSLRQLMGVDLGSLASPGAHFPIAAEWAASFAATGRNLAHLASAGVLRRGLREVLVQQIIFAMNRLGLHATTQALLATTAAAVVFDPDPTVGLTIPRPFGSSPEGDG